MKKAKMKIEGMTCASCAGHVEKSLSKVKGVKNISVNAVIGNAFFEAEDFVSEKQLKDAVKYAGYVPKEIDFENLGEHSSSVSSNSPAPENKETEKWQIKLIGVWVFTIQIIFFMYSKFIFGKMILPEELMTPVMLALSFPVIFIFGFSTVKSGLRGFFKLYFSMDSLIALGTVIAFFTGILSFFMTITSYAGVSGMIMTIFITGKYIETKAKGRATSEIRKLLELGAKKARIIRNGKEIEIPIEEVKIGDILIIKPGEKIPTDGIVISGESSVDESMISGESIPVDKIKGSAIIGATINQDGILHIKATKIGKDTFLSHIIKLVEEAQGTKVPIQKIADKITNVFVPVILVVSLLTFLVWLFFLDVSLGRAVGVGISVLVIACPCALGLAVPISLAVGSGIGAKKGILIRRGEAIQTMKRVKIIVFDKTGTITKGKPEVIDVVPINSTKTELLRIAGSIEKSSEHPIAMAVVKQAEKNKIKLSNVKKFKILRGRGAQGILNNKKVLIGNRKLMQENKINIKNIESKIAVLENQGKTTMIVVYSGKIKGLISVADAVKEYSKQAISQLKKIGLKTIMITGDNELTAKAVAKQVGIDRVLANVLPQEKLQKVKELQNELGKKGFVAFVGDGINDAPALKQSNVGIAIGSGSDIAIEVGDIVLATGNLSSVVSAINLSKATFSKIKQNLFWAFFYNVVAIPLAIAGVLNPVIAEIAMALSSISVVTNANLLRRKRI